MIRLYKSAFLLAVLVLATVETDGLFLAVTTPRKRGGGLLQRHPREGQASLAQEPGPVPAASGFM